MWAGYLSMQPAECVFWGLEVWNVKTTRNPYQTLPELCVCVVGAGSIIISIDKPLDKNRGRAVGRKKREGIG